MRAWRWGWYRDACDEALAAELRTDLPGYHLAGGDGSWNAVHRDSLAVFGPLPLRRLRREIEAHDCSRPARTLNGASITFRAGGDPR